MDPTRAVQLLRLCATEGNEDQWHELCLHLRPMLRRFITLRLKYYGDSARAAVFLDDLVQEIFCRLLARNRRLLHRLAELAPSAAVSYLIQMCHAVVVDRYRRQRAICRGGSEEVESLSLPECRAARAGNDTDPEHLFLVREARRVLRRALEEVASRKNGKRESEIFELATVYQWTSREIATVAEPKLSPSAIDVCLTRTRKKLEKRFFPEIECLRRTTKR